MSDKEQSLNHCIGVIGSLAFIFLLFGILGFIWTSAPFFVKLGLSSIVILVSCLFLHKGKNGHNMLEDDLDKDHSP